MNSLPNGSGLNNEVSPEHHQHEHVLRPPAGLWGQLGTGVGFRVQEETCLIRLVGVQVVGGIGIRVSGCSGFEFGFQGTVRALSPPPADYD